MENILNTSKNEFYLYNSDFYQFKNKCNLFSINEIIIFGALNDSLIYRNERWILNILPTIIKEVSLYTDIEFTPKNAQNSVSGFDSFPEN